MKFFRLLLLFNFLFAFVLSGKTVSDPAIYQVNGPTVAQNQPFFSTAKYTPYDLAPDTTIADLSVTITWFRTSVSGSFGCLNPSPTATGFNDVAFSLYLIPPDAGGSPVTPLASESLIQSSTYSSTSVVTNQLFVQTFIISPNSVAGGSFSPDPSDNYINYQSVPQSGYFVPVNGFDSFLGLSIYNRTFTLYPQDLTLDNNAICFTQFEVTLNCQSRAVIYKPTLSVIPVDNTNIVVLQSLQVEFKTQEVVPLQSTLSFVSVTLAWTKNAAQFGTCAPGSLSGRGDRHLQSLQVQLTYTPFSGNPITVVLVKQGTWTSYSQLATQNNYFSTTFDSTSVNAYPNTILGGRYQSFQSLSVFNGLSPWGTWQLNVQDFDNGYITCVYGARITLATCTDNASCICGSPQLGSGANLNAVGDITTTAVFH